MEPGKRISIEATRAIIRSILNGSIDEAKTITLPYFNLKVPVSVEGVDDSILDPRDTYADPAEWDTKASELAGLFIANFEKFTDNEEGQALVAAGPSIEVRA